MQYHRRITDNPINTLIEFVERIMALLLLVALIPLLALIALVIRMDSQGPALFIQRRIAKLPRDWDVRLTTSVDQIPSFPMFKFRTYFHRSESMAPSRAKFEFEASAVEDVKLQLKDDPRITRV